MQHNSRFSASLRHAAAAAHGPTTPGTRRALSYTDLRARFSPVQEPHPLMAPRKKHMNKSASKPAQATQINEQKGSDGRTTWSYESRDATGRRFSGSGFDSAESAKTKLAEVRRRVLPVHVLENLPAGSLVKAAMADPFKPADAVKLFADSDSQEFSKRVEHRLSESGIAQVKHEWHGSNAELHRSAEILASRIAITMPPALRRSFYELIERAIQSPYQNPESLQLILREWLLSDASDPSGTVLRRQLAPFLGLSPHDLETLLHMDVQHANFSDMLHLFESPTQDVTKFSSNVMKSARSPSANYQPVLTLPPPETATMMLQKSDGTAMVFDRANDLGADVEVIAFAKAQGVFALQATGALDVLAQFSKSDMLSSPDIAVFAVADKLTSNPAVLAKFVKNCPLVVVDITTGEVVPADLHNAIGFLLDARSIPGSNEMTNAEVMKAGRACGFNDAKDMARCKDNIWAVTLVRGMEMALADAVPILDHLNPAFTVRARALGEQLADVANWRARHSYFNNLQNHTNDLVLGALKQSDASGVSLSKSPSFRAIHEDLCTLIDWETPQITQQLQRLFPLERQLSEIQQVAKLCEDQANMSASAMWDGAETKWADMDVATKVPKSIRATKSKPQEQAVQVSILKRNTPRYIGSDQMFYNTIDGAFRTWYQVTGEFGSLQGEANLLLSFKTLLSATHDPAELVCLHDLTKPTSAAHAGAFALSAASALRVENIYVGGLIDAVQSTWRIKDMNLSDSDGIGTYVPRGTMVKPNPIALAPSPISWLNAVGLTSPGPRWKTLSVLGAQSSMFAMPELLMQADQIVTSTLGRPEQAVEEIDPGMAEEVAKWKSDLLVARASSTTSLTASSLSVDDGLEANPNPLTSPVVNSSSVGSLNEWVPRTVAIEYVPKCVSKNSLREFLEKSYGEVESVVLFDEQTLAMSEARKKVRAAMFDTFDATLRSRQDGNATSPVTSRMLRSALESRAQNDLNGGDSHTSPELARSRFEIMQRCAMHANHNAQALVGEVADLADKKKKKTKAKGKNDMGDEPALSKSDLKEVKQASKQIYNSTLQLRETVALLSRTVNIYESSNSAHDAHWESFVRTVAEWVKPYHTETGHALGQDVSYDDLIEMAFERPSDDDLANFTTEFKHTWLTDGLEFIGVDERAVQEVVRKMAGPDLDAFLAMASERLVLQELFRVKMRDLDQLMSNQDALLDAVRSLVNMNDDGNNDGDDGEGGDGVAMPAKVSSPSIIPAALNESAGGRTNAIANTDENDDDDDDFTSLSPIIPGSSGTSSSSSSSNISNNNSSASFELPSGSLSREIVEEQTRVWRDVDSQRKLKDRLSQAYKHSVSQSKATQSQTEATSKDSASLDVDLGTYAFVTFKDKAIHQHFQSEAIQIFGIRFGVPSEVVFPEEEGEMHHFNLRVHAIEKRTKLRITGLPQLDRFQAREFIQHHCSGDLVPESITLLGKSDQTIIVGFGGFEDTWRSYHKLKGAVVNGVPVVVSFDFGRGFVTKKKIEKKAEKKLNEDSDWFEESM